MPKRIKLFYVVVIAFVITAVGLITLNRLDGDIAVLENAAREARLERVALETENGNMTREVSEMNSDSYIRKMARKDNKYLMPGEIRFVVVNPEALYAPGEMPGLEIEVEEAEGTEMEAAPAQEDTEG